MPVVNEKSYFSVLTFKTLIDNYYDVCKYSYCFSFLLFINLAFILHMLSKNMDALWTRFDQAFAKVFKYFCLTAVPWNFTKEIKFAWYMV